MTQKTFTPMKPTYNTSKIMRNAWYLKKNFMKAKSFGECLRKAWSNEKMNMALARIEGRTLIEPQATTQEPASPAFIAGCLDYYANARTGTYFGD